MRKKTPPAISLLVGLLTLMACDRVSDPKLKRMFSTNADQLSRLVQMANEDRQVTRIDFGYTSATLSTSRWNQYRSLFKEVGIESGLERRRDFPSAIFFLVDCSGSAVDKDCKGFAYSATPLAPLKNKLELAPGVAFEPVAGDWYLFRDGG